MKSCKSHFRKYLPQGLTIKAWLRQCLRLRLKSLQMLLLLLLLRVAWLPVQLRRIAVLYQQRCSLTTPAFRLTRRTSRCRKRKESLASAACNYKKCWNRIPEYRNVDKIMREQKMKTGWLRNASIAFLLGWHLIFHSYEQLRGNSFSACVKVKYH